MAKEGVSSEPHGGAIGLVAKGKQASNSSNDGQKCGDWLIGKDLSIRTLSEHAENSPEQHKEKGWAVKKKKARFSERLRFIQTNRNQEPNKAKLTTSEGVVGVTSGCLLQHLTRAATIATAEGSKESGSHPWAGIAGIGSR